MTVKEQCLKAAIETFIARRVPEKLELKHREMIGELAVMFFMDYESVATHLRQCNEHLDKMILNLD